MSVERKTSSYRIDRAPDGCFDVIQTSSDEPDTLISRHPTRDAAKGWLVEHLKLINMDDMTTGLEGGRPERYKI
jgi:hypothetical protein